MRPLSKSKDMIWQSIARPLLFCLPAETAHYSSMGAFSAINKLPFFGSLFRNRNCISSEELHTKLFGLNFLNPVGLAAGFDKDARWYNELATLGFSHIEVGTLTGKPQSGNDKPRLFRLSADKALINRMGFNNQGADLAARRLAKTPRKYMDTVLGLNIGKTKVVPVDRATDDYLFSFERLYSYGDYFTVNVSSPNTPGLRSLQNKAPLIELLSALASRNRQLAEDHETKPKPILLKIAPDVTEGQLNDIVSIAIEIPIDGIIATNTTIARTGLKTGANRIEEIGSGGLSGAPLKERSREVVSSLYRQLGGKVPIIGVGGISDGKDAWQMILAGASLLQIYTGFIYGGPSVVRNINRYLLERVRANGLKNIADAVGNRDKID